jgi:hypothetical protein
MADVDREAAKSQAVSAFTSADAVWGQAMRAHQLAPPDLGFADRLRKLADAAARRAHAARIGHLAGLKWVPVPGALDAQVPYELRPGTGRRGPRELWQRFDGAVIAYNAANADSDLARLADAAEGLSEAAEALSGAIENEDHAALTAIRGTTAR